MDGARIMNDSKLRESSLVPELRDDQETVGQSGSMKESSVPLGAWTHPMPENLRARRSP
jgi:hypothetical protein